MRHRRKRFLLWLGIPILVVVFFFLVLTHYLLDPDIYRNILQKSLTTAFKREVSIGKAKLYLWGGVGIAFEDFRVKDRSQAFDLLQSKRLILRVKLFPLFRKEVKWKQIVIEQPHVHLVRNRNGQLNIFLEGPLTVDKLKGTQKKILEAVTTFFGGSLALREGKIFFSDESLGASPLKTEIRSFNVELSKVAYREAFPFRINGKMIHSDKEGFFSIHGTIQNIPENLDLSKGSVEAEVKIKGFDTFHFWPYLKTLLPMETISGDLDLNAHYQGDFQGNFKTSARIKFKELLFDYPQVFSSVFKPKWATIDVEAQYDSKEINIPTFSIELPELWVKAKGRIYGIGSKEMGMEAEAHSSPFDIAEGKKFIPFRIITPDVSEHLFRAEGKGSFQIKSVRLAGKMPEIDQCDQLVNAHVLSIEANLSGAQLKLPWNLPTFENLTGQLLFLKGNLYLKEVEGRIFHSTLEKVNGAFYELLHIPTLQMDCQGKFDLTDLPLLLKTEGFPEEFNRALSSINVLSGKATYSLTAKGLLRPPIRFQHQGTYHLSKTRIAHPQIPFQIQIGEGQVEFSDNDLRWSEVKVELGHSTLMMNGFWKHGEKNHPLETIAKGRMDLKNLFSLFQTPIFPEAVRSKISGLEALSGAVQISVRAKTLLGTSSLSYEGMFSPKDATLLLKGNSIPLIFKEGGISFSNLEVGFSKTKIQSGGISLTLDGLIQEEIINLSTRGSIDLKQLFSLLKSPFVPENLRLQLEDIQEIIGGAEVRLKWVGKKEKWIDALKEGEIRLKGIHLKHREISVPLTLMEGYFLLTPEQIRFEELKGKVGDSLVTVSGTSSRGFPASSISSKKLSFQISSPQLDLDPLFPKEEDLSSPLSFKKIRDWLFHWSIEGKMNITKGRYRSLNYQDLKAEMKTVDETLFIRYFQCKADGGDLWGEGWIKPTEKGIRFEIKPRVSNMEAKAFARTLFQKDEEARMMVTGRVHIDKVELQGEGEDFQKVKESLQGSLRFEVEKGIIERWGILSKIFSILNVSQLFMGRLPDLKTKGLPYHQIRANFYIKDGIVSTEDFFVDSDAMRITLIGKVDLGKNTVEARIGVHPLVTIDTILSSVPIAGYILTGKDKAFISYFYEVKGNVDDPKIEAIPLKSIEEPSWGLIKRLLETPLRPFQKAPSFNNKGKNSSELGVQSPESNP